MHTSFALERPDPKLESQGFFNNRREPDRRTQAIRFPIRLPVIYLAEEYSGAGEIVNISSRVALFTTDTALALDACVKVYIKWPVLLLSSVQLSLIASGRIVRIEPGRAALAIAKHEFRTCVPSFYQRSQQNPAATGVGGWLEGAQLGRVVRAKLPQGRSGTRADLGQAIAGSRRGRGVEGSNERWERVFQEKFADPEYYNSRALRHSSPTADF
jgi:hypothetical protein